MKRLAFLISGRGSNMKAILDAVDRGHIPAEAGLVLSSEADAPGMGISASRGIPTHVIPWTPGTDRNRYSDMLLESVENSGIDLVILAGFMVVLAGRFLNAYRGRIINIHPSLLPAFPGAHAHRDALRYGVKVSGCTVHFIDEGVDSGPIILQEAVIVRPDDTEESLSARILQAEHRLFPEAVRLVVQNRIRIEGRSVFIEET